MKITPTPKTFRLSEIIQIDISKSWNILKEGQIVKKNEKF